MKKVLLFITIVACVLMIAGCYSQTAPTTPTTTGVQENTAGGVISPAPTGSAAVKHDIEISGFAYNPPTITISRYSTVIWTNQDSMKHTVTSDSGTELDSELFGKGQSYTHTFNTPGTFTYHCTPHPNMKGTVIVEDSNLSPGAR